LAPYIPIHDVSKWLLTKSESIGKCVLDLIVVTERFVTVVSVIIKIMESRKGKSMMTTMKIKTMKIVTVIIDMMAQIYCYVLDNWNFLYNIDVLKNRDVFDYWNMLDDSYVFDNRNSFDDGHFLYN